MAQSLEAADKSFWKPGNFKKTTRRITKGYNLCLGLEEVIERRGKIEKSYATDLKSWSKKWRKCSQYDKSMGPLWQSLADEANCIADAHLTTQKKLLFVDHNRLKSFRANFYHKVIKKILEIQEEKQLKDAFMKVQKPYLKHLKRIEKAKRNYYKACDHAKLVLKHVRYASAGKSKLSHIQIRQMENADYKVFRRREKYLEALDALMEHHPKYIENMTSVFNKCQANEEFKLQFLQMVLFSLYKTLDITPDPNLAKIYGELYDAIETINPEKKLKWWSKNRGINMKMITPKIIGCSSLQEEEVEEGDGEESATSSYIVESGDEDSNEKEETKHTADEEKANTRIQTTIQEIVELHESQQGDRKRTEEKKVKLANELSRSSSEASFCDCIEEDDFFTHMPSTSENASATDTFSERLI